MKKRQGKRKYRIPRQIPVLLSVFFALGTLGIWLISGSRQRTSEYDLSARIKDIYRSQRSEYRVDAFAEDIAVLSEIEINDADFTSEAGLMTRIGGDEVIFSKNAMQKMNPASTTKIMTAYLALKYGNLQDEVVVGEEIKDVDAGSSLAGLKVGDRLSLEELLYGLMLPSGNDAANAIAVHVSGSMQSFIELMNAEAVKIGATHTHFQNPSGLTHDEHYTTAYDLYLIFQRALQEEKFSEIAGTKDYTVTYTKADGTEIKKTWTNGNRFLGRDTKEPEGVRVYAGKTGTTKAAGSCLVLACTDKELDEQYVGIVLKAGDKEMLYQNMYGLMEKYSY